MNYSLAVFLMDEGNKCRGVLASYEVLSDGRGKKPFTFYKTFDPSIKVGDRLVVPTDTRHNFTVVRAEAVDVEPDYNMTGDVDWVVGKIDMKAFDDIRAREAAAIAKIKNAEKRKHREQLREDLKAAAGEDVMRLPAYVDPEAAKPDPFNVNSEEPVDGPYDGTEFDPD